MSFQIFTASCWIQLSSLFFLLAGLSGDLLVIRFFLFIALMILIHTVLGSPTWPNFWVSDNEEEEETRRITIDGLVWAVVSLYVQAASLIALFWDERDVQFSDEAAEALWRMMYRTGGLSKRLFQTIVAKELRVIEVPAGHNIPTDEYFYIIYNGRVRMQIIKDNYAKESRTLVSGEMFDLAFMGMFLEHSVFHDGFIRCTAMTSPVQLFQIRKEDMRKMAHHPLAKSVWQALLINNLSYVVESYLSEERKSSNAELRCDRIFRPLEEWEKPKSTLAGSGGALKHPIAHLISYIQRSFSLPWPISAGHPTGIRQTQLPPPPLQPKENQEPPSFHGFDTQRTTSSSNNNTSSVSMTTTTTTRSSSLSSTFSFPSQLFRAKKWSQHNHQTSSNITASDEILDPSQDQMAST